MKLIAWQLTLDLFDYIKDEFIPEISEYVGTKGFVPTALPADVSLFG